MDETGFSRALGAINTLEFVTDIRNSLQHVGTEHRGAAAFRQLGIGYPVTDWSNAWELTQTAIIDALTVLREELQFVAEA